MKAASAMAANVLISCKVKRGDAGRYVAAEARELGLHLPNGKEFSGGAVLRWRDEIEISKSEVGVEVLRVLKVRQAKEPPITDVSRAKTLATELLRRARFAGFWVPDVRRSA